MLKSRPSSRVRRLALLAVAALSALSAFVGSASAATTVDYSPVTTGIADNVTAVLPLALASVGLVVGIFVAYKVLRKLIRA